MGFPWTPAHHALIQGLWMAGLTASQIAARIGPEVTRNMIIGKAHRLGLDSRPSPIKELLPGELPKKSKKRQRLGRLSVIATTQTLPRVAPQQIPMRLHPVHKCRWPTSDDRPWTFCEQPAVVGYSYCECHVRRAYQPKLQAAE